MPTPPPPPRARGVSAGLRNNGQNTPTKLFYWSIYSINSTVKKLREWSCVSHMSSPKKKTQTQRKAKSLKAKPSSLFLTILSFSWFKKPNPDQVLGFLKVFSFSY